MPSDIGKRNASPERNLELHGVAMISVALGLMVVATAAASAQALTDEQIAHAQNPLPMKMARCYMQPRVALEWSCFRAIEAERAATSSIPERCRPLSLQKQWRCLEAAAEQRRKLQ